MDFLSIKILLREFNIVVQAYILRLLSAADHYSILIIQSKEGQPDFFRMKIIMGAC